MAFVFHIHTFPSCETTHNTACSSLMAPTGIIAVCRLHLDVTEGSSGVYTETLMASVMKKRYSYLT